MNCHIVINAFRLGMSREDIFEKYGDFGKFIISEFEKQPLLEQNLFTRLSYEERCQIIDDAKIFILKNYQSGISEDEILSSTSDYGKHFLKKLKEFYSENIEEL